MVEGEGLVLNFHLLKKIQKEEKKKKKRHTYIICPILFFNVNRTLD